MHGNSFTDLRRVIIEGSRGVGKRLKRQDEGCRTDLKKKNYVQGVLYGLEY